MFEFFENYWDFEKDCFVYKTGGPEKAAQKAAEKTSETFVKKIDLKKLKNMKPEKRLDFVKEKIGEKHSPDKYEEFLKKRFGKDLPEVKLKKAVSAYKAVYENAMATIYRKIEARTIEFEDELEKIRNSAKNQRERLRIDIESNKKVAASKITNDKMVKPAEKGKLPIVRDFKIPIIHPIATADIPIISPLRDSKEYRAYKEFQNKKTDEYLKYTNALSTKYLESAQHKARLNPKYHDAYEKLTDRFKGGMEEFVENQMEYIFTTSKTKAELKSALTSLQAKIKKLYESNDRNGDNVLDIHELAKMDKEAKIYIDLTMYIKSSENAREAIKKLESKNLLNKKSWVLSTNLFVDRMIMDVNRDGTHGAFVKAVENMTNSKKLDYGKAKDKFRSHMRKLARTGVLHTIDAAKQVSKEVNGERDEILEMNDVRPPSIRNLVRWQRDRILSRSIMPKGVDDRSVAEFMSTDIEGRKTILKDPVRRKALFQAIQNIKTHYPRIYSKRYKNSVPKDIYKIGTRPQHQDRPTKHDQIARMLAMLTLAKESEWVIKNLDKSYLKGEKVMEKLENTEAEKVIPKVDMKFNAAGTLKKIGYISRAERGGFNLKSMGIGALQVWAGLTLFLNYMNARKEYGWIEGAQKALTNPYFLAGGGLIYGLHKYKQNPKYADYFKEGPGGQERIAAHASLTSLANKHYGGPQGNFTSTSMFKRFEKKKLGKAEKVGKNRLIAFITNPYEFKAMEEMFKNPRGGVNKVRTLLRKSQERANKQNKEMRKKNKKAKGSYLPVITREDMKSAGIEDSVVNMLPPKGNERMRFLFYQKFLTNDKVNVRQLKANCEKWI